MRIAVTTDGNNVSSRLGKTLKFRIFEVLRGQSKGQVLVDVSACGGHEALTYILKNEGVDVLLCGEITEKMRADLEKYGIKVIPGLRGNIHALLKAYVKGHLRRA